MKKIRIYDNGHGLLVSTKDITNYLFENKVLTDRQSKKIAWNFERDMYAQLKNEFNAGSTSTQINIFDFQDMFICWVNLWQFKKYFSDKQSHNPILWKLFLVLDSPHEIRNGGLFENINTSK